jgi:tRNA/tmRNA/rRNA uracil-C5-methylase (TrmA/RlmC/RlmD family)
VGLKAEITKNNEPAPSWYRASPAIALDPQIICSDKIDAYRNKVEFTVGIKYDESSKSVGDACVGFNVGNSSKGINFVDLPDEIKVNSKESLEAAQRFERIVKSSGQLPFNKNSNSGLWRILLYRESVRTKQVLICFVVTEGHELSEDLKSTLV